MPILRSTTVVTVGALVVRYSATNHEGGKVSDPINVRPAVRPLAGSPAGCLETRFALHLPIMVVVTIAMDR